MISACLRAQFIYSAAPGCTIQIDAIVIGAARQGKSFAFVVEVIDDPRLGQAPRDQLERFFHFKGINHPHPYKVANLHLGRHRAAGPPAAVAKTLMEFDPGGGTLQIGGGGGDFLHRTGVFIKQGVQRSGCRCI